MSALVDEVIKLCRAEELKLTQTVRQYKDLLHSMKTRVKDSSEEETQTSVKDKDIPLEDRQEVELLDQVLRKALKIRSRSAIGSNYHEEPSTSVSASKAPGDKRNQQKPSLSSSEIKKSCQRAGQLKSTAGSGDVSARQKTRPSFQPTIKGKLSGRKPSSTQKTTGVDVQMKPCQMTSRSLESDGGSMSIGLSSSEERTPHSGQECKQSEPSACKEQWVPSPSLPLWQTHRTKKNRLWNKVLTRHAKPVPERDHFKKRLISTFPTEWAPVHIAAMEAELDVLTQLGLDLTHCYNAELRSHQLGCSPEPSNEKEYQSLLMLAGLEKMMVQAIKEANHLKKDWVRKMAWWNGELCSLCSRTEWHDSEQPCLSPMLACTSRGELEDLHSLRLNVAQLKQEVHMHQVMCDALSDLISCESSSSEHPSATALRGVYSLLGEGGAQFPSLVLDTDSEQT